MTPPQLDVSNESGILLRMPVEDSVSARRACVGQPSAERLFERLRGGQTACPTALEVRRRVRAATPHRPLVPCASLIAWRTASAPFRDLATVQDPATGGGAPLVCSANIPYGFRLHTPPPFSFTCRSAVTGQKQYTIGAPRVVQPSRWPTRRWAAPAPTSPISSPCRLPPPPSMSAIPLLASHPLDLKCWLPVPDAPP